MIPSAGHNWQTKRKFGSERGGYELSINWKHGAGGADDSVWISNLLLTSQTTQSIKALNSMVMYTIKLERPYIYNLQTSLPISPRNPPPSQDSHDKK